ncbi:PREDICTED: jerky protein homolog-like [Dufourea novaeangliae]|uniref:jerky protein homolog-like n=1 Tax=Dufourea novaeangliae TaxID=178035 RepID=UPI000766EB72|nr:PREDICTED: jerky protein homolog-like [Dufourea novaeangliae]
MSGSKRHKLTVKQRLEILKHLEDGATAKQVSSFYNVHVGTIRKVKYDARQLHRYTEQARSSNKKRMRRPINKELEGRLYTWFLEKRTMDDPISNRLLREEATNINKELGGPITFRASENWLTCFKIRYKINNIHTHESDEKVALKFIEDLKNIMYERDIDLDNLYNMDETGLAWKSLPKRTLDHLNVKKVDGKLLRKYCFTMGLCSNASGSHKLPLLIINKYASPRALKHCKNRLPVVFKSQPNACMNRILFLDWYENDFKPSVKKHQLENGTCGSVLLIVDDCKVHNLPTDVFQDERFHVMFLPQNASSLVQPMNQGIIRNTKSSFRYRMLQLILSKPGGVYQFFVEYDLKESIELINQTWMSITPYSIKNAWCKLLQQVPEKGPISDTNDMEESTSCKLQESIQAIVGGNIALSEVEEWLSICAEMEEEILEDNEENIEKEGSSQLSLENDSFLDDEFLDIETMFKQLLLWSKNEPKHIRLQVQFLKKFHYKN